ncbi:hypothetical protein PCH_Pc16g14820 [Penicillium rubens Wisconsin 54-1255]|uniref:Uncharacterized protein n=1 Tax=Penicillium rubens (strain ATCC 28089 / DSM 1075 / NRRL 1951 / Wisconsin 54-1255) TaxID=500485 RepID=B6HA28_PENRW|nr:hypothetical protein PCH_Pc16g14820 [Penicillium rubens Wisconsin 54-1255]
MHYITALFLTASLLGMVAATGNPVHRYAQLCACGQPGCRASNFDEEGIYGDCIDLCVPLDNYNTFRSVSIESVESGYTPAVSHMHPNLCKVVLRPALQLSKPQGDKPVRNSSKLTSQNVKMASSNLI